MTTTTSKFDVGKYLVDDKTVQNYLDDCLEEGGTSLFLKAVGEVARARGMTEVAESAGLTRASLYKSLGESGNPAMSTMEKVIDALGFRLAVVRKSEGAQADEVKARTPRAAKVDVVTTRSKPERTYAESVLAKTEYSYAAARKSGTNDAQVEASGHFVKRSADGLMGTVVKENSRTPAKRKGSPR